MTLSIDGPGVYESYDGPSGSADVPFSCGEPRHTYLLTTTGGEGAVATEEIVVRRAQPEIVSVAANTLSLNGVPCSSIKTRRIFWAVKNAVGVRITPPGGQPVEFDGREGNGQVPYDCGSTETVTYLIETTGPYGPHASTELEVGYVP